MDIKEAADFVKKEAEKAGIKDIDDVKELAKKAGIDDVDDVKKLATDALDKARSIAQPDKK